MPNRALVAPLLTAALLGTVAGCPRPTTPRPGGAAWSRALTGDGAGSLRGIELDDTGVVYVAVARTATRAADALGPVTTVSAITADGDPRWTWSARSGGGPIARAGTRLVAAIAPAPGRREIELGARSLAVRGDPGAALLGLDVATGALAWSLAVGATGWAVIAAIDGHAGGDAVAVGSFSGSLRIADAVVTSAGNSDGFAVRVGPDGAVRWLVRMGGAGADALTAVAIGAQGAQLETIAVAGSITGEADLRGTPLVAHDVRQPTQDVAVARLDSTGLPRWGRVFGGDSDDAAAGVAILPDGAVAVAATVRDVLQFGGDSVVVRGTSDTLVAVHAADGAPVRATLVGGQDYDGARALAVAPDGTLVVGGWFAGTLRGPLGDVAADGEDAFVARFDHEAHLVAVEPVAGAGREDIVAIAGSRIGVAIGVAHTAGVTAFGTSLPAPADPLGGIAVVVRP